MPARAWAVHAVRAIPSREGLSATARPSRYRTAQGPRPVHSLHGLRCPVDLSRDARCPYCAGPIEAFDVGAAAATVLALEERTASPARIDVDGLADALLGAGASRRRAGSPLDLVETGLQVLASWLPGR